MVASEDNITLVYGLWLAGHIPGAQLVTAPGGHLGQRDTEEEQLIAWLASRQA